MTGVHGVTGVTGVEDLAHPLGPSPAARAALVAWAQTGALERYDGGAGAAAAGALLVKQLAAQHGVPLDAVVLGSGIAELAERALAVLLRPGDQLVANTPSWPAFPALTRARGAAVITVPYVLADRRADCQLDAIAAACARAPHVRAVYLISPSNPMGAALDDEPFARFVAALPPRVTVIVDEAYAEFCTRREAVCAPDHVRRGAPVIALRSFSKFYGLAALRIGYAIAPPPLAAQLAAAAHPFALGAGAQLAAAAALGDRDHCARTHALVARSRAALAAAYGDQLASDAPFALVAAADAPGPRYFDGRYAMVSVWATDATDAMDATRIGDR